MRLVQNKIQRSVTATRVDFFLQKIVLIVPVLLVLLVSLQSRAGGFMELNAFYFSDAATVSTTSTRTEMLFDGCLGFDIDKTGMYQVGWNYSSHSVSDASTTTTTYTSAQMGPKFVFYFNKERTWALAGAYNLITTATYSTGGSTAEKWRGTSMNIEFGYGLPLSEAMRLGLRLIYSAASYTEVVTTSSLTTVSYARTLIYPAIHMSFHF